MVLYWTFRLPVIYDLDWKFRLLECMTFDWSNRRFEILAFNSYNCWYSLTFSYDLYLSESPIEFDISSAWTRVFVFFLLYCKLFVVIRIWNCTMYLQVIDCDLYCSKFQNNNCTLDLIFLSSKQQLCIACATEGDL